MREYYCEELALRGSFCTVVVACSLTLTYAALHQLSYEIQTN